MIARETVAGSKWLVFPQICGFPFFPDEKELSSRKNHSDAKFGSQQLFFFHTTENCLSEYASDWLFSKAKKCTKLCFADI